MEQKTLPRTLILSAPSASGKTYYLSNKPGFNPDMVSLGIQYTSWNSKALDIAVPGSTFPCYSDNETVLVDGDTVIETILGWPAAPDLHRDPDTRFVYAAMMTLVVQACTDRTDVRDYVVFFNGIVDHIETLQVIRSRLAPMNDVQVAYVIPSLSVHKERVKYRHTKYPGSFPVTSRDVNNNRNWLRSSAEDNDIPVYTDFESAITDIDSIKPIISVEYTGDKAQVGTIEDYNIEKAELDRSPAPLVVFDFDGIAAVKVSTSWKPHRGTAHGMEVYSPPPPASYWYKHYDVKSLDFMKEIPLRGVPTTVSITRDDYPGRTLLHITGSTIMYEQVDSDDAPGLDSVIDLHVDRPLSEDNPDVEKSVDGFREYNLHEFHDLSKVFDAWPWAGTDEELFDKLLEEVYEAKIGEVDPPSGPRDALRMTGTSRMSEIVTVAIICFKIASRYEISPQEMMTLMAQRHAEQYNRYHDEPINSEGQSNVN